jgi:hypothetical protein
MVKCTHKQDNGQMVYFLKHSVLQMKNLQVENKNQGGFFMMVMSMPFGYKT